MSDYTAGLLLGGALVCMGMLWAKFIAALFAKAAEPDHDDADWWKGER